MIIAIDGPASSGKSSIARELAKILKYKFISSGYLYRLITYIVQSSNRDCITFSSEEEVLELLNNVNIKFDGTLFLLDGKNITSKLITAQVDFQVAYYSTYRGVRDKVNHILRDIVNFNENYIVEGRDITTIVFPTSPVRIYLDASVDIRAERRFKERAEGRALLELKQELIERDRIDKTKEYGRLELKEGVFYIDTSFLSIEDVCKQIIEHFNL